MMASIFFIVKILLVVKSRFDHRVEISWVLVLNWFRG
jgi:hypothetical protein